MVDSHNQLAALPAPESTISPPPHPTKDISWVQAAVGRGAPLLTLALVFLLCEGCAGVAAEGTAEINATATAQTSSDATATALVPTPTLQQHATNLTNVALKQWLFGLTSVTYDNGNITIILVSNSRVNRVYEIQGCVFDIQRKLFTSYLHPKSVTITINGPLYDRYGNETTGLYAKAVLTATTATKFNWDNLGIGQAWSDYDDTWMRDDLGN